MYEGKHCPSPREMQFLCVLMWFAHFTVFPLEKKKKKKGMARSPGCHETLKMPS